MTAIASDKHLTRFDDDSASLASLFEDQVVRNADRIAVVSGDSRLTYSELNHVANRIAQIVLAHLGSAGTTVALLFQPGTSIVAAILGVLKAGKIYVALDPSYPPARTAYMLEDCQAKLLLTNTRHMSVATQLAQDGQEVVNCDGLDVRTAIANPDCSVVGVTPAVLLYTSGSTGNPKGVLHNHRNVLIEVRNYTRDVRIGADDRLAVWHSFSFANSIRNLYGALMNGAGVFPYDLPDQGLMPLGDWIRQHEITMIHTLATTFRGFVDTLPDNATFPSVRILRLGGEPIHSDDVKKFKRHFPPPCLLMHVMGPTETFSIRRHFIDHAWTGDEGKVPVGYPVSDKEVLLLDDTGRQVGPDETGEIVVRSKYLAIGYWRLPQLTEAAFLPDPAGGDERMYRTGDLGRMRPDGCLFHLGRKDFQVKIRGHRVEVAEVETALLEIAGVKEAVVVAREATPGEQRLVAYLVPAERHLPTVTELRRLLAATLPDYMVPSSFVTLEAMPLTATGKVDRRALPSPDGTRPALDTPYAAPRDPLEAWLTATWAAILGLDRVGIYDTFLDLGGDSLRATMLLTRVLAQFQARLSPRTLLDAPTVAAMAEVIVGSLTGGMDKEALDQMLAKVEVLSEEDARSLLRRESS